MKSGIPESILRALAVLVLLLPAGCSRRDAGPLMLSFEEIASPAAAGSGEPNLFVTDGGRLYMSWIERAGEKGHRLKFSVREGQQWTEPRTIATGQKWFVNWADFPSVVASANGSLAAHWLARSGSDPYAYDIQIAHSRDGGTTWSDHFKPHTDGTQTEHGFVSMLPWNDDRVLLVWLDGRKFAKPDTSGGHGGGDEDPPPDREMTLRTAMMDPEGRLYNERSLDERVCDCCQTSAIRTTSGAVFAYRDRSNQEIRDISIARFHKGRWEVSEAVSDDGWKVPGCPVNGPQLAGHENRIALAWFTNAGETARVKVMFSRDEGESFGPAVTVDDGDPMGRVDIVMLRDGSVLVSWMEYREDGADIRLRRIHPDGRREPSITLGRSSRERAAGFPQMALAGDRVYMAWTVPGDPPSIHTAAAALDR